MSTYTINKNCAQKKQEETDETEDPTQKIVFIQKSPAPWGISWNIQSTNTVTGSKFDDSQFCAFSKIFWKQFKKLKNHKSTVDKFDSHDMSHGQLLKFFRKLY